MMMQNFSLNHYILVVQFKMVKKTQEFFNKKIFSKFNSQKLIKNVKSPQKMAFLINLNSKRYETGGKFPY
jgi:hypothetical protein